MGYVAAAVGLCVGSFLNVLADRLPRGEDIFWGRSHCDWCRKTLRWYELIPVLSFILQKGRCIRCGRQLSLQYPVVEAVTAFGFWYLYTSFSYSWPLLAAYLLLFCSLLVICVADLKYQVIPDSMIVVGALGAILSIVFGCSCQEHVWAVHILSSCGAGMLFVVLWAITRGRGMGLGDVKFSFLMGLILGFPDTVIALYVAFLTGASLGVILILGRKKSLKSKIAFGPFLVLGTVGTFLFREQLLTIWNLLF
jgi:leader peptidase (prepilin peptidase)/N-methyltransferase